MAILRAVFWLVVVILVAVAAVAVGARFHDGPIALFPGGPLKRGELVSDPNLDWTFAKDVREMELESDGRSRTVWVLVYEGQLYVPASTKFPPFKRWHLRASQDPRAVVRIAGKRYRRELQRIEEPELLRSLREVASNKYSAPPGTSGPDDVWVFRLGPPRDGARDRQEERRSPLRITAVAGVRRLTPAGIRAPMSWVGRVSESSVLELSGS